MSLCVVALVARSCGVPGLMMCIPVLQYQEIASSLDAQNPWRPGTLQTGVCGGWTAGGPLRTKRRPRYPGTCGPSFPPRLFFRIGRGQRPRDLRRNLRDAPQYPLLVTRNYEPSSLPFSRLPESNQTQALLSHALSVPKASNPTVSSAPSVPFGYTGDALA